MSSVSRRVDSVPGTESTATRMDRQSVARPIGQDTPVPPSPQYPLGFFREVLLVVVLGEVVVGRGVDDLGGDVAVGCAAFEGLAW